MGTIIIKFIMLVTGCVHRVPRSGYLQIFIHPELEMVKYLYVEITIVHDVLWRGREGVLALSRMLI